MSNLKDTLISRTTTALNPIFAKLKTELLRCSVPNWTIDELQMDCRAKIKKELSAVVDNLIKDIDNDAKGLEKKIKAKETTINNLVVELKEKDNLIKELETDKDPLSKKLNTLQNSEKQLLQIFKEYKDEIMLFETFQANIRREQAMFLSSTVKEVRKSLEESEIDKACQDAWIKELVDNYNSSLKLSSKLIDDSIMNLIVNIKEEIYNTINQINK